MVVDKRAVAALRADPAAAAIHRSLDYYYGRAGQDALLDAFYARFVGPGDLVFDVGAHVGDRVGSFRRLGARVVAVEPQPVCVRALREIYAGDEDVVVVEAVCAGTAGGAVRFYVNSANPTVSTASAGFVRAADGARGWQGQVWDERIEAATVTLDLLIATYGTPAFTKIDVEGFEGAVLAGLTRPLPALSFEFTTIEREAGLRCLDRVGELGFTAFDVSLGDSMTMEFGAWVPGERLAAYLRELPHDANSGDVYCLPGG